MALSKGRPYAKSKGPARSKGKSRLYHSVVPGSAGQRSDIDFLVAWLHLILERSS